MNKKEWLDYLYYDLGKQQYDFRISGLTKNKEGEVISTKWKKYSEVCFGLNPWESDKIDWVNNREILPYEVVIDLEEKKSIKAIIKKLKEDNIDYRIFTTHSRGYHIHIWFNRALTIEEKTEFITRFLGDKQKAYEGTSIALEGAKHWKSGKIKEELKWK